MKRMESGSLLAICAMCFSMSFFVMIPSSLLMTNKERRKEKKSDLVSYFVMECQRQKADTHTHTEQRVEPPVWVLWLHFVLLWSLVKVALLCLLSLSKALATAFQLTRGKERNPGEACFGAGLETAPANEATLNRRWLLTTVWEHTIVASQSGKSTDIPQKTAEIKSAF